MKSLWLTKNYISKRFCQSSTHEISKMNKLPLEHVVKIHSYKSGHDRIQPWQSLSQKHNTGSGFIIKDNKILTNAHCIADHSFVTVTKHNSGQHYHANVVSIAHECDIAMLEIQDKTFFNNINGYLTLNDELPELQNKVIVCGYPTGGDSISVTKGVVSRVEVVTYIHAGTYLLGIQIDAAINSGNSGGPALMDNKVIGIAFQNMPDADNVGYIIPTTVINHFMGQIERFGEFRGICFLGIQYQTLPDTYSVHKLFNLDVSKTGVLITKVLEGSPAHNIFKLYDIILEVDGNTIMNDGSTFLRPNETIAMEHLISMKYPNDDIHVKVWRDGKEIELTTQMYISDHLVPLHLYDKYSSYYIFGGCVFISLNQPYLHTWHEDWYHYAPKDLVTEAIKGDITGYGKHNTDEYVIMSIVRPHTVNMGANKCCNIILERIGDTYVKSLKHLKEIIQNKVINGDELIDFYFRQNRLMVLNINESILAEPIIFKRHRIPSRQSLDLDDINMDTIFNQKMDDIIMNDSNNNENIKQEIMEITTKYDDLLLNCIKEQNDLQANSLKNKYSK